MQYWKLPRIYFEKNKIYSKEELDSSHLKIDNRYWIGPVIGLNGIDIFFKEQTIHTDWQKENINNKRIEWYRYKTDSNHYLNLAQMVMIPKELAIPINRKLLNPKDKERLEEFKKNLFVSQTIGERSISQRIEICFKMYEKQIWWHEKYASPYEKMKQVYFEYLKNKKSI